MKNQNSITINEKEILIFSENGENYIAIKPICEALGVAFQNQIDKIKDDEILSSVVMLSMTTGADGKSYKMSVIPYKYVFGWLFTINPNNVKEEAKEALIKYKRECYDALYDRFTSKPKKMYEKIQIEYKLRQLEKQLEEKLNEDPVYKEIQEIKNRNTVLDREIKAWTEMKSNNPEWLSAYNCKDYLDS
ncbi:MAG: phage antirepressor N-terminal domain-containing protein [Bacteroidetes bacterium]|nr:phage antirepressor N-terminal domain-containing protein [Bacteroidota bacterium]